MLASFSSSARGRHALTSGLLVGDGHRPGLVHCRLGSPLPQGEVFVVHGVGHLAGHRALFPGSVNSLLEEGGARGTGEGGASGVVLGLTLCVAFAAATAEMLCTLGTCEGSYPEGISFVPRLLYPRECAAFLTATAVICLGLGSMPCHVVGFMHASCRTYRYVFLATISY